MRGIPSTEGLSTEGSKRNSIIFGHRKKNEVTHIRLQFICRNNMKDPVHIVG